MEQEQSFISHLTELRDRLLRVILVVLLTFLALSVYANEIYAFLAGPLLKHMPANSSMIAIEVASPFLVPFKLAFIVAIFITMPFSLYQFWAFVAPGLYAHEKRLILPLLVASILLFYLGMVFAYILVFPLVFGFLTATAPPGVTVMTDIGQYLNFVLTLLFAFGVSFQVPIVTLVLVAIGAVTPNRLAEMRPYVIVAAFIIGMVLTPPDVASQTLLAIPMWFLFELGLLLARIFLGRRIRRASVDATITDTKAGYITDNKKH